MKKKISLCIAAFVATICFISCADIFSTGERDSITVTVPAFSASSGSSRAANTDNTFSKWNVYAFLFGNDIDSDVAGMIPYFIGEGDNNQFIEVQDLEAIPSIAQSGLLDAVIYRGVNFAHDVSVQFKRVKQGTEYFVCLAITYDDKVVFGGINEGSKIERSTITDEVHASTITAQAGVNDVALTLKKNEYSGVYFLSQSGTPGNEDVSLEESTPKKPASVEWISKKNFDNAVIILTEDVSLEDFHKESEDPNNKVTVMSLPGKKHTLTISSELILENATLSLIDVALVYSNPTSASVGSVQGDRVNLYGYLEVGGDVTISGFTIALGLQQLEKIFIVSPLESRPVASVTIPVGDKPLSDFLENKTGNTIDYTGYFDITDPQKIRG